MEDEEEKTDEEGGKEGGKEGGRVESCYRHLIHAHPSYDRAYVNLGGYFYIKGDMEKAAALYMKALEINPENAIATHALGALQGEKLEGASLDYLSELFDSYSATFDASLHALEYKSPELMRRAVDWYLDSPEGKALAPEVSFCISAIFIYYLFSCILRWFLIRDCIWTHASFHPYLLPPLAPCKHRVLPGTCLMPAVALAYLVFSSAIFLRTSWA
jgi:tetratricopeptide (TPR) repeat protein